MSFRLVYLGRSPKPKDLIGRALYALGGVMRGLGGALDSVGAAVQGPYARQEERECRAARGSAAAADGQTRCSQRPFGACPGFTAKYMLNL
jgi:hypothetical protein